MKPQEYYDRLEATIPKGQFRTRFAPSPTGYMHLGNLRTALYAYLLAKKANGVFMLRIEDTDQERKVEGATEVIFETLKTVGINWDEGPDIGGSCAPYVQSERKEIYGAYAEMLINKGHAYYCFCDKATLDEQRLIHQASRVPHKYDKRCLKLSPEEVQTKLAQGGSYVIRQNVNPDGKVYFDDAVYGRIDIENSTLEDQVILKSDGLPTYNFANVVDDHLMGITHVIRGNEFLSSTPKHVLLYQGFGWTPPAYIHAPQIMRDSQRKLSKRDGDAYFDDFIDKGYLKEAILNYIALLGWSPGGETEKFSLQELVEVFDVSGISKSPAIFDLQKLKWVNKEYLLAMSAEEFHAKASPYIRQAVASDVDTNYIAGVLKERCELLADIPAQLDFIDVLPEYTTGLFNNPKKKITPDGSKAVIEEGLAVFAKLDSWNREDIHHEIMEMVQRLELKNALVFEPLRAALSGKAQTPGGAPDLCMILGKDEVLARLQKAIEKL